ncbi:hypothetical protein Ancab_019426 [Ancistrocladus abbreviatus]
MDKNQSASKQMGVREKFRAAISSSHVFRSIYWNSKQPEGNGSAAVAENLMHPEMVPIIFDASTASSDKGKSNVTPKVQPRVEELVILLPIQGKETGKVVAVSETQNGQAKTKSIGQKLGVDGMEDEFSEYISRAGSKIRAASTVGAGMSSLRRESFNDRVSGYISRARLRFRTNTMPSYVETTKTTASVSWAGRGRDA